MNILTHSLKEKELSAFRNKQIGFVFQFYNLVPNLTALENVYQAPAVEEKKSGESVFEKMYQSAIGLIDETNRYTHEAEEAQMSYMLGLNDNVHDLLIAQNKANLSLQYTVAIRNGVLDAYKELMQMQF